MPHVIVKLWPGKSEQQKERLADAITKDIMEILNYGEKSISVAMQEVKPQDWAKRCTDPRSRAISTNCIRSPDTTRRSPEMRIAPARVAAVFALLKVSVARQRKEIETYADTR